MMLYTPTTCYLFIRQIISWSFIFCWGMYRKRIKFGLVAPTIWIVIVHSFRSRLPTTMVYANIGHDSIKPSVEWTVSLEAFDVSEHLNKSVLRSIKSILPVPKHAECDRKSTPLIPFYKLLESALVTLFAEGDELLFWPLFCVYGQRRTPTAKIQGESILFKNRLPRNGFVRESSKPKVINKSQ